MRLYLLRHGIAIDREDPECPADGERWLTPRGAERTRAAAAGLRRLGVRPRALWSSPLVRAVQTAEIAARVLDLDPEAVRRTDVLSPDALPEDLLVELVSSDGDTLCVGHAPNLDDVLAYALGWSGDGLPRLKKAGAACVDLNERRLVWFLDARSLRGIAR